MSRSNDFQIAIIGGGLAGSAAGALLAHAGWRVAILERDTFPRDKLCGEFLSGESRRLLDKIGCLQELLSHNPPEITHVRFISTLGKSIDITLPQPAMGISRRLLDETLFRHACKLGATGFTGCDVTELKRDHQGGRILELVHADKQNDNTPCTLHPHLTIAAYGRRSKLDRDLQRPYLQYMDSSVGLKLYHTFAPNAEGRLIVDALAHTTEVYGLNGGYCGLCLVEGGRVNVCMLLTRNAFSRIGSARWPHINAFLARENPALGKRLSGLIPVDEAVLTVSQMPFGPKGQEMEDLLFIGDAAGMIAPLCGDGQAMALESGVMAAEMINQAHPQPNTSPRIAMQVPYDLKPYSPQHWQLQWQERFGKRMRTGRVLQRLLLNPVYAHTAIGFLRLVPQSTANYLAKITRGA